ncbi:Beta-lactamase OXY-2 precursor [Methyloligella halotolerans]|uniref:Beta-lactamase n=1 Tax=Methyloligella halotolerans TaxID=1177755 RepID=A0A1E2RWN7_9HYPH|nr:class A beta-lactamase [Methyloligella halotolerans]ODA66637.1 Beta-lactamase OXY-2 precursor [Methyloligella halotolerans]
MITRRLFVQGAAAFSVFALSGSLRAAPFTLPADDELAKRFAELESSTDGRLGVAVFDSGSAKRSSYRGDERFPMCSTFKYLAAGAVLKRVDEGKASLDEKIPITKADMLEYAPVTEKHIGEEMSLEALCEAIVTWSDNPAANLVLKRLGGPEAVTEFARSLGDEVTRLDRYELALNDVPPGDTRDTTSPRAMANNLDRLVRTDALSDASRRQLIAWLVDNHTGDNRIRAGLPKDWKVGDKTGTGPRGSTNDVGVAWPPDGKPVFIAVYLTDTEMPIAKREAVLASVARTVAETR